MLVFNKLRRRHYKNRWDILKSSPKPSSKQHPKSQRTVPGVSKGCCLEAFKYSRTSKKHSFVTPGSSFLIISLTPQMVFTFFLLPRNPLVPPGSTLPKPPISRSVPRLDTPQRMSLQQLQAIGFLYVLGMCLGTLFNQILQIFVGFLRTFQVLGLVFFDLRYLFVSRRRYLKGCILEVHQAVLL